MTTATKKAVKEEVIAKTIVRKEVAKAMKRMRLNARGKRELIHRMQNKVYVQSRQNTDTEYNAKCARQKVYSELMTRIARTQVPKEIRALANDEHYSRFIYAETYRELLVPTGLVKVETEKDETQWFDDCFIVRDDGSVLFRIHCSEAVPCARTTSIEWVRVPVDLQQEVITSVQHRIDNTVDTGKPIRAIGKVVEQAKTVWDLFTQWPELAQEYCTANCITLPTADNVAEVIQGTALSTMQHVPPDLLRNAAALLGMKCSIPVTTEEVK